MGGGLQRQPKGTVAKNFTVFLVNPKDGSKIIVSNSTVGQKLAFESLKERVGFMRRLRGESVIPVVMLSSKSMRTKFGLKPRPEFEIVEWKSFGGNAPALPPAQVKSLPGGAVAKPTPGEIIEDSLPPWDDPIPENL